MSRTPLTLQAVAQRLRDAQLLLDVRGPLDFSVTGVSQDSRAVGPGDLFLAWKGREYDAHKYLPQVAEAGASAAVVEEFTDSVTLSQLKVSDGRLAAALVADAVLGSPWRSLFMGGVTGTNGKTTTAVLARHLLQRRSPSGAIGTLGLMDSTGAVRPGTEGLTTPGPVTLSSWISGLAEEGFESLVMEASSHALDQFRLDGLRFDAAAFTTLGRDHLDYHADMAEYRDAKARLLDLLKPEGWAVVNADDRGWDAVSFPQGRTLQVGVDGRSDLRAEGVELLPHGSTFELVAGEDRAPVALPLLGRFNIENALSAAGIAYVAGMSVAEIAEGLTHGPQIPGRIEVVVADPFTVLIDFAHTPDALETVLKALRPVVPGRLIVLFGAGGDRDRGKRARMGEVVARLADLGVVTSDNPRTEDPELIIDDVVEGMVGSSYLRVGDRKTAIGKAVALALPGDLVLLAGKGHESYQVLGREKHPFDEKAIVHEALDRLEGGLV
jgi:UDP-N-acetylmuramoyl-L-alanyl-D-glutamate--2,6-diaminopimelate ligase